MKKTISKIMTAKKIAVFCHSSPDADALGSVASMKYALEGMGKEVDVYLEEELRKRYDFLRVEVKTAIEGEYDLLISVDVASSNLLGKFEEYFLSHKNTLAIDHHLLRTPFAGEEYVETLSSTCEILSLLFDKMKVSMTSELATYLYTGLAGDTGCFMHDNTTARCHDLASKFIKYGADYRLVNRRLFKSNPKSRFDLIRVALNNFEFVEDALIVDISQKDFKKAGVNPDEGIGLIGFISTVEDVNLSALITERKPGLISISFRSSEKYDVAEIAEKFGGGGHKQAAGCKDIEGTTKEVKAKLKRMLKNILY